MLYSQVFSADGITVLDPEVQKSYDFESEGYRYSVDASKPSDAPEDRVLKEQTKESLCNGEDCGWGYPVTTGFGHLVVPNYKSNRVVVFKVPAEASYDEYVVANVPTCQFPFRVDVAAWRHENGPLAEIELTWSLERASKPVFTTCITLYASRDGNIDTLNMANWAMKQPLVDAAITSSKFVHGNIVLDEALPEYAYSTNTADPGYHKIHLESRKVHFVNLESEGCTVASNLTISGSNRHGFIRCSNGEKHFILEINLENDKRMTEAVFTLSLPPASGLSIVIADDQQHKLQMYKANGNGKPSEPEATVDGIEGFSQLTFVSTDDESKHVAVVSSLTQFKVLLVDMNNYTNIETVEYHGSHDMAALNKVHGGQRSLAATYVEPMSSFLPGHIVIAVSAPELDSTFVIDFKVGSIVPWEVCAKGYDGKVECEFEVKIGQVQGIQGDSMKMIYVNEPGNVPAYTTVSRNIATTDALEKLETKVADALRQKMSAVEAEAKAMKQQLSSMGTTMEQSKQQVNEEREAATKERQAATMEREAARAERKKLQSTISSNDSSISAAREVAVAGVVIASVATVGMLALAAVVIALAKRPPQLIYTEKPQPCQDGKLSKASHKQLDTVSYDVLLIEGLSSSFRAVNS
eukprot:794729-Pelagomonas_calceolata.AAC.1